MNQNTSLQILKSQLRHFGLNPLDWNLVRQKGQQFMVIHREDQELRLVGRAEVLPRKVQWQTLSFQSL